MSKALAADLEAYCQRHDLSESAALRRALHLITGEAAPLDTIVLAELRKLRKELGAIGRNLNMAVRALQGLRSTDPQIGIVLKVREEVESLTEIVCDLLSQHQEPYQRKRRVLREGGDE